MKHAPWTIIAVLIIPLAACSPDSNDSCPSCEDGIQNQGEEGIDCGGPCRPCDPPADYYLSATGDDGADGRTPETAWRTIAKLQAQLPGMQPGQRVALRRGDVFQGALVIGRAGTEENPITMAAYGPGPRPLITGFAQITSWTAEGGGVYSSVVSCESPPEVVVVDGVQRPIARWPNEGAWAHYEAHVERTSITDVDLAASPDWTGAELVLRASQWAIVRNPITGHVGSTLTFASVLPNSPENDLKDGWGYFVQGSRAALDTFGEFFYDPGTSRLHLFFGTENPDAHTVEVAAIDTLVTFDPGVAHFTLDGLAFTGANKVGIRCAKNDALTIRDCSVSFVGNHGLYLTDSTRTSVLGSKLSHCNDKGVFAYHCHDLHVADCTILNTGLLAGLGLTSTQAHIGILAARGDRTILEGNRILNSGYSAINHSSTNGIVRHNFIDTYCFMMQDGGGIYYGGQTAASHMTFEGNIVLNGLGAPGGLPPGRPLSSAHGIYIDYNTLNGVAIRDNTVAGCVGGGIFIHESPNIEITGNTVFDCQQAMQFGDSGLGVLMRDITMTGNVFSARTQNQLTLGVQTNEPTNDFSLWGIFDNNRYLRPIDDDDPIQTKVHNSSRLISLAEWQAFSGQDAHSHASPLAFPAYVVDNLSGANLFANGGFDASIEKTGCWNNAGNCVLAHDTTHLDGGALAVSFDSRVPTSNSLLTLEIGAVSSKATYVLRFSLLALADPGLVCRVYLRKRNDPWTVLTAIHSVRSSTTRAEQEIVFFSPTTETDAVIVFSLDAADSTDTALWLDNVELHEAEVTVTDPGNRLRLEYNATSEVRVVPLDGIWTDAHGQTQASELTLAPFTSVLLMR